MNKKRLQMKNEKLPMYTDSEISNRKDKMTHLEIKKRFNNETAHLYSQREPA